MSHGNLSEQVKAQLSRAVSEGLRIVGEASDLEELDRARARVVGRRSPLATARGSLREVPLPDRKALGQLANDAQSRLEKAVAARREALEGDIAKGRWERERIDVTLPGDPVPAAALHPLTQMLWEVLDVFIGLGYRVAEGPDVELTTYVYDALNFPEHHPSRSPQESFYIAGQDEDVLLRSHTSPMQIRVMEAQGPPVYVVMPGRCYRRDVVDPTHLNGFYQMEGLAVDEGITMGDLKGSLEALARAIFGRDLDVRLRPHYFPFTEPSAELDVQCFVCRGTGCRVCKQEGWIEVLGCGMVHPCVLDWVGYDTERFTGFAFGMGIERIAALAYGVGDIRHFYESDVRFLSQFEGAL